MRQSSQAGISNSVSAISTFAILALATTSFTSWKLSQLFTAIADGLSEGNGSLIGISLCSRFFAYSAKAVSATTGAAAIGLTATKAGLIT